MHRPVGAAACATCRCTEACCVSEGWSSLWGGGFTATGGGFAPPGGDSPLQGRRCCSPSLLPVRKFIHVDHSNDTPGAGALQVGFAVQAHGIGFIIDIWVDLYFILDLVLNFFTPFESEENILVSTPSRHPL
eukprot:8458961-Pyramimonas_sp.AAC.1